MKILCIGSINIDKTYRVEHIPQEGETVSAIDFQQFWGGKGLNQSVALAKTFDQVYLAGNINEQDSGLREFLREHNVHDDHLRLWKDKPTGHAIINVDKNGQNCILIFGGANRAFTNDYVDEVIGDFSPGDLLLLQNEINGLDYILRKAHAAGMRIAMNPSPFEERLKRLPLELVDIFIVNEIEGFQLTGCREPEAILRRMKELLPRAAVVLTLGGSGSIYSHGDTLIRQPIYRVPVVDTTAAGDTFTGYFLSGLVSGMSPEECMDRASKASAIAVAHSGATVSIPTLDMVLAFDGSACH